MRENKKTSYNKQKRLPRYIVQIKNVSKTLKGGRKMSFVANVVSGDNNGKLGFGSGKSNETKNAIRKASRNSEFHSMAVPSNMSKLKSKSIPFGIKVKFKSTIVHMLPARTGTGVVAPTIVREMLSIAGYKNIIVNIIKSRNKANTVKCVLKCLERIKTLINQTKIIENVENKR